MNHFRDCDQVYIFGFSRGAYTARVVAAMLHLYGLAMPGNDPLVPYAVRMLWALAKAKPCTEFRDFERLAREFKRTVVGASARLTSCVGYELGWVDRQPADDPVWPLQSGRGDCAPRQSP